MKRCGGLEQQDAESRLIWSQLRTSCYTSEMPAFWTRALPGAVLLVAIGLSGPAAAQQGEELRGTANRALIDERSTERVLNEAKALCEALFSYDYRKLAEHARAVEDLAVGKARSDFRRLHGLIEDQASAERVVNTTVIQRAAVRILTSDKATVLLFVKNTARTAAGKSGGAGALQVKLERHKEGWKAADVIILGGSPDGRRHGG